MMPFVFVAYDSTGDEKAGLSEGEGGGVAGEHTSARPVTDSL
jgi:hypothetical protein